MILYIEQSIFILVYFTKAIVKFKVMHAVGMYDPKITFNLFNIWRLFMKVGGKFMSPKGKPSPQNLNPFLQWYQNNISSNTEETQISLVVLLN